MSPPIIKIEQGELQGVERELPSGKKFYSFKGIPYAEPPLGNLRFKAPRPPKPWSGLKDASKEGNRCTQINILNMETVGDEDCLYLNVYTPSVPTKKYSKLIPVMVYIHGGGFAMGSGHEEEFGPDFFIEHDVILVSMNYRLDVLGFLCLDTPEVPGNAGLIDQHMALKWVQKNIEHFNGDSNNVTLFGISAGSASVEYQLISPRSEGLFHRTIMESGSALNPWARMKNPKQMATKLATVLGIQSDDPNALLEDLQKIDIKDLKNAITKMKDSSYIKMGNLFGFAPVVEKTFENVEGFINSEPLDIIKSGNYMRIPTIAGFTENEGEMFILFYENLVEEMNKHNYSEVMESFSIPDKSALNESLKLLYEDDSLSQSEKTGTFLSDLMFVSGINISMEYRVKRGEVPNYGYMFTYVGELKIEFPVNWKTVSKKSVHGGELPYLTKMAMVKEDTVTETDQLIRKILVKLWTNFAKNGEPTNWDPVTLEDFKILDINTEPKMIPFPWKNRMKIWERIYEYWNNKN